MTEKNSLDASLSVGDPISLDSILHSNLILPKGSIFQGRNVMYQIHTEGQAK